MQHDHAEIEMVNVIRVGVNITRNTLLLENTRMTLGQSMVYDINQRIMPRDMHVNTQEDGHHNGQDESKSCLY